MKTLKKIKFIIAAAALSAVFACAPEFEGTFDAKWPADMVNNFNSLTNWSFSVPLQAGHISGDLSTANDYENTITISLPNSADVLIYDSKDDLKTGLGRFISFWSYDKSEKLYGTETSALTSASANIKEIISRGSDPTDSDRTLIEFSIDKKFSSSDSDLVVKITGSAFTFGNGAMLDVDGFGIPGEKDYDDIYVTISVLGIDLQTGNGPVFPGNRNWGIGINSTLSSLKDDVNTDTDAMDATKQTGSTHTFKNVVIASANMPNFVFSGTTNAEYLEYYKDRFAVWDAVYTDSIVKQFKIEEYNPETKQWSVVSGTEGKIIKREPAIITTPSEHVDQGARAIVAESLTVTHGRSYRAVFVNALGQPTTASKYFDVNQRLTIAGKKRNLLLKETGTPYTWHTYNSVTIMPLNSLYVNVNIFSQDVNSKNTVLEIKPSLMFTGIKEGTTPEELEKTYWFKKMDTTEFKQNVEILLQTYSSGNSIRQKLDIIKEVEYLREGLDATADDTANNIGFNVIRITLDPSYKFDRSRIYWFRIDEIPNESTKTKIKSNSLWQNDGKMYIGPYSF